LFSKKLFLITICLITSLQAIGASRCNPPDKNTPLTKWSDWPIYTNPDTLKSEFVTLYKSQKRLENRAYWDGKKHILSGSKVQELPSDVISALASHISQAIENDYAEVVSYPDMGHVHVLVPESSSHSSIDGLKRNDLLFLYHTAELLKMQQSFLGSELIEDSWLQWRYYSRNFVGTLDENQNLKVVYSNSTYYNTVRSIPGYKEWTTLYFSASHEGCFEYKHKTQTHYFDISTSK
jgi:hypothetical protein